MIYFTGDIHGAVDGIADFINKVHPTMEDVIVLLGDGAYHVQGVWREHGRHSGSDYG